MKIILKKMLVFVLGICMVLGLIPGDACIAAIDLEASDVKAPVLKSLVIDKHEATVGDTVTITAEIEDESRLEEFSSIAMKNGPDSKGAYFQKQEDGRYQAAITITEDFVNGTYKISYVNIYDIYRNRLYLHEEEVSVPYPDIYFNVTGAFSDDEAPVLKSLSIDKHEVTVGDTVTITAEIEDESELQLNVSSIGMKNGTVKKTLGFQKGEEGKYQAAITITEDFVSGTYKIYHAYLYDIFWNGLSMYEDEVAVPYPDIYFTVVSPIPAEHVSLSPETLQLEPGETARLVKSVEPSDTTDDFAWESQDEDVATVSDDGVVEAKKKGTAVITVTAKSGVFAECIVTVRKIPDSVGTATLFEGCIGLFPLNLLPENETDHVIWNSQNPAVVAIDEGGKVTGIVEGTAEVTALTESGFLAVLKVTVLPLSRIAEIQLSTDEITLEQGEETDISISGIPEDYIGNMLWESEDNSVAIAEDGHITSVSSGDAVIMIKVGDEIVAECSVHVRPSVESVRLSETSKSLTVGDVFHLEASFLPAGSTDTVTFTSGDTDIASVDDEGTVTAKQAGTCVITATTAGGKQASCEISVLEISDPDTPDVEQSEIDSANELMEISNESGERRYILREDVSVGSSTVRIQNSAKIELDLNGHSITGNGTLITNNGVLAITDTSREKKGEIAISASSDTSKITVLENNGTFYLKGGKLSAKNNAGTIDLAVNYAYTVLNKGVMEMSGGEVYAGANASITRMGLLQAYSIANVNEGGLRMNGGIVTAEITNETTGFTAESNNNAAGIYHNSSGDAELYGGTITANIGQNSVYQKVTNFCSAVWNHSIGTVKIDGAKLYSNNKGEYSPGSGYICGLVGQGEGMLQFLSGEIHVDGKGYAGYGINNVNGLLKEIGEKAGNVRDKVRIVSNSNVLGAGIADTAKVGVIIHCANIEATHCAVSSNGMLVVGRTEEKMKNQKIKLSVSASGYIFNGSNVYIYAGDFLGRLGNASVKLIAGYELSDKARDKHCERSVILTRYGISYQLNGGANHSDNKSAYTVLDGMIELKAPSRKGYVFKGWYKDAAFTQACTAINAALHQNVTVYAKWAAAKHPKAGEELIVKNTGDRYKVIKSSGGAAEVRYMETGEKNAASVVIPDRVKSDSGKIFKVTSIDGGAFEGNKRLVNVKIGNNVSQIGNSAFYSCEKLKTVTMGKNVVSIGDKAFYKCAALSKITIPSKVGKIGKQAFFGCKKLKSVTVKTTKLTTANVGSKAWKGIHSKAKIKAPKNKVKSYKSLFRKKGAGKKVVVKK